MSCICQYLVTTKSQQARAQSDCSSDIFLTEHADISGVGDKSKCSDRSDVSASELAASKAEIWVLKKNLADAQISIDNLENLVRTVLGRQNELMSEMYELRQQNNELQEECRMQRDYQTMERNAMMRELHDVKLLLATRTKILEETAQKNVELTEAVQDANEKIYMMGVKFLKLKTARSKCSSAHSSTSIYSDRSD